MENNSQNQNPNLPPAMDLPPAMPDPNAQPTETASVSSQSGPTIHNTGVPLGSPIISPTHFDNIKAPNPVTEQQAALAAQQAQSAPKNNEKFYMTLSIIFGALAFIGIVLGIWSLVANISTSKDLDTANAALAAKSAIVAKVESDTGKTINTVEDVPDYEAVSGNIYVEEWGIKFHIPDDLTDISYTVDSKYRPQICFAGYQTGVKYFPSFADIDQNPGGLGCITRVATYEGEIDKETGISFGQKIYTYGDYSYFYNEPASVFSQSDSEKGLEATAVQIIKNMLSNNISHFE